MTRDDVVQIASCAEVVATKLKPVHGACLYASAALAVVLSEENIAGVKVSVGSLSVKNFQIFRHVTVKDAISGGKGIPEGWFGHAWVSIEDIIIDMSVFQTIYTSEKKGIIEIFDDLFGGYNKYLLGQADKLNNLGVFYTELESLNTSDVNALFSSGIKLGIICD